MYVYVHTGRVLRFERLGNTDGVLGISKKGYLTDRLLPRNSVWQLQLSLALESQPRSYSNILLIQTASVLASCFMKMAIQGCSSQIAYVGGQIHIWIPSVIRRD